MKQPAWVTGIEVIDQPETDYWEDRGQDDERTAHGTSLVAWESRHEVCQPGVRGQGLR